MNQKADYLHWLNSGELWVMGVDYAEGTALLVLAGDPGIPERELDQNIWPTFFIWISRRETRH